MRKLAVLVCLFTLAACGQPASDTKQAPPAGGETDAVILGSTQDLPDWLFVARQRDCIDTDDGMDCQLGEVHFNQRTITRGNGMADIWIQVRHGHPQIHEVEDATTITTVRYEVQRLHYRFNCETEEFIVVERQIMGPGETVAARDEPRPIYRPPGAGSITSIIMPIACRGT